MNNLIVLLTDIFFKLEKEGKDGFMIIKLDVPLKVLSELYERLIKEDVPAIETLSTEEKTRFWEIAKKYYDTEKEAIIGTKACYVLNLICNN